MYSNTFNCALKLANAPLQKLATFYMFNEKQKDYGMEWTKTQSPVVTVTM